MDHDPSSALPLGKSRYSSCVEQRHVILYFNSVSFWIASVSPISYGMVYQSVQYAGDTSQRLTASGALKCEFNRRSVALGVVPVDDGVTDH